MRYSCKAVVGHGQKCEPNYQCDACAAKQKYIPRIETLEAALREIHEVYAGSEGIPEPMTAAEGYLLKLLTEMIGVTRKALEGKDE